MKFNKHPYYGMNASIATMHGKEKIMAPILQRNLGIKLHRCETVNTDFYGTFTGEIPRPSTMLETARKKAKEAVLRSGYTIGLGSEGSFGPDPFVPFLTSGIETILLYHATSDHEIYVQRKTITNYNHITIKPNDNISIFLDKIGFPSHAVTMKPEGSSNPALLIKGINNSNLLFEYISLLSRYSHSSRVIIQTDMRAHLNPTRMNTISLLTKYLVLRIMRLCPCCGLPGFGKIDVVRGLQCSTCEAPTSAIKAEIYSCNKCLYKINRHVRSDTSRADPKYCDYCNP